MEEEAEGIGIGDNHNGPADVVNQAETVAFKKLEDLKRGDGLTTPTGKEKLGILHTVLSPHQGETEYRKNIIILDFTSRARARKFAAALDFCKRWKVDTAFLFDRELCEAAANDKGRKNNRVQMVFDALTKSTFITNGPSNKNYDNRRSNSPIGH